MWNPFRRRRDEYRSIDSVPWDVGGPSHQTVNEHKALGLSYVYAANRHLGDLISTLPLHGYHQSGDRRQKMATLPRLFRDLDRSGQLPSWLFEAVVSIGLHGNAVGAVTEFDGFMFPASVVWLPMTEVHVDDSNLLAPQWYWKGRRVDRDELVHVAWFKLPGRTLGLSPIESYALTIVNGLEAQAYGTSWFENGGFPPGTFKNSAKTVPKEEAEAIRARLVASIRRRQPLVHGSDWEYNPITVPPEQAQFIETLKLTAGQVAAIYGIAPEEIGGEAANGLTYKNEEHRQTRRIADAQSWLVRLESAFSALLPERQYVKFAADAVARADLKTRHEVFAIDRKIGLRSINELRALDDLPPVPGGDAVAPLAPKPAAPAASPPPALEPVSSNGNGRPVRTLTP